MVWFSFGFWWARAVKYSLPDLKHKHTALQQQNKIKTAENYMHRILNKINWHDIYQKQASTQEHYRKISDIEHKQSETRKKGQSHH